MSEYPYVCQYCGREYKTKRGYMNHLEKVHPLRDVESGEMTPHPDPGPTNRPELLHIYGAPEDNGPRPSQEVALEGSKQTLQGKLGEKSSSGDTSRSPGKVIERITSRYCSCSFVISTNVNVSVWMAASSCSASSLRLTVAVTDAPGANGPQSGVTSSQSAAL